MKYNISFVSQITDMDSGEILFQLRRRVDPDKGVVRSVHDVLGYVVSYLEVGKSVSLEINFIVSGFSDRNNIQFNIL